LEEYVRQQVQYLSTLHPNIDKSSIETFVKNTTIQNISIPTAHILDSKEPGDIEEKSIDLLTHIRGLSNNILTPSGTTYKPPNVEESPIRAILKENINLRKINKSKMLEAIERGDSITAQIYHYLQSSNKIFNNSIPGAMGSKYNPFFDLPGYNSITSPSRHCVRSGFVHTERIIEANIYITTLNEAINYCTFHMNAMPNDFGLIMDAIYLTHGSFYIPTVMDLYDYLESNLKKYTYINTFKIPLLEFLSKLSEDQRTFIYYAGCLIHLFEKNKTIFLDMCTAIFSDEVCTIPDDIKPEDIFKVEGDMCAMMNSVKGHLIKNKPIDEHLLKEEPDGLRELIYHCKKAERILTSYANIFSTFLRLNCDMPNIPLAPNIVRKATLVSDTDSVIFTTRRMVEWRIGKISFTKDAYEINALTVYFISRTLVHIFARLSIGIGMIPSDIGLINMKNEFLYPVMMRTPMSKHYAGLIAFQEGKRLPVLKKDIKGLNFRSSNLSKETNETCEKLITYILENIISSVSLSMREIIKRIVEHEIKVYNSVKSREVTFLENTPIKREVEYTNPYASDYFYYTLWTDIFEKNYGEFTLPDKGYSIPIRESLFYSKKWHERVKEYDPDMYTRIIAFIEKHPKRTATCIIIPPSLREIPEVLLDIVDFRKIVFVNGSPLYLVARSLNIGINYTKDLVLMSDFYNTDGIEIPY
jgi:hypothetical protein